jgi:hypothetical protein
MSYVNFIRILCNIPMFITVQRPPSYRKITNELLSRVTSLSRSSVSSTVLINISTDFVLGTNVVQCVKGRWAYTNARNRGTGGSTKITTPCGKWWRLVCFRRLSDESAAFIFYDLDVEAVASTETCVNFYQITRRHIPEPRNPNVRISNLIHMSVCLSYQFLN